MSVLKKSSQMPRKQNLKILPGAYFFEMSEKSENFT